MAVNEQILQAELATSQRRDSDSLFNPLVDFFGLGGISLVIVPLLLMTPHSLRTEVAVTTLFLAHFINHPHFMHSYQIFYRGFLNKLTNPSIPKYFRYRYAFAGVVVPALLSTYLVYHFVKLDLRMLGLAGNAMAFLVGWHYVKQGYGMMMVQAVLKKQFLNDKEKSALLYNAYACWFFSYLFMNHILQDRNLWGVEYWTINVASHWVYTAAAIATATGLWVALTLWRKPWRNDRPVPIAGIFAYFVSLYVWLFAGLDPLLIFAVPALHSLQYLTVVYRFELNYQSGAQDSKDSQNFVIFNTAFRRFCLSALFCGLVGYLAFWQVPYFINDVIPEGHRLYGGGVVLFVAWIFINVHHYFIDNVIWRRENPETGKYLFAAR